MKAVMLSIRPKWCDLIATGRKTVEVRKTRPKIPTPFKCYIYCTKDPNLQFWTAPRYSYADDHSHNQFDRCGNGRVIGEFICDWCDSFDTNKASAMAELALESLVPPVELLEYMGSRSTLFGWHISDLVIYDTPLPLTEFVRIGWRETFDEWEHYSIAGVNTGPNPNVDDWRITRPPQSWCYVEETL